VSKAINTTTNDINDLNVVFFVRDTGTRSLGSVLTAWRLAIDIGQPGFGIPGKIALEFAGRTSRRLFDTKVTKNGVLSCILLGITLSGQQKKPRSQVQGLSASGGFNVQG
jgi:hypothetical protein